ncbi:UbiX family flavin prenyltransferase [Omnitrophica bacterium]|nr:UbiX family flavin prenyltransferase [Candidatus Omnitrophota bacterium]
MKPYIVAITGASGVVYGARLVQHLLSGGHRVALVISEAARMVIREELQLTLKSFTRQEDLTPLIGTEGSERLELFSPKDFTAPIASGSYPVEGMVIIPCSMGTLGAVASGVSGNLIHRAADCVLKEGKRLVLVPRETPLNAIHLENMLKLSKAGVRIVPAMPGFYSGAQSLEEMVDFMVGKVLDQCGIEHMLYARWVGLKNQKPFEVRK